MVGGVVGQLFVLYAVKMDKGSFAAATKALHVLRAASVISGFGRLASGIAHVAETAAESATHVVSLSQAMGMSTGMAQRWGYVAQQSSSNLKELSVGVSMFLSNLRKLAQGDASPKLQKMFRDMHLSATDAKLAMSGPEGLDRVLMKTSDRLKELGVNGNTAALGSNLFGRRAGRALVADMIRGSAAIKEMQQHFKDLGGEIGDKQLRDLRAMNNSINDIKVAWKGVSGQIIGTLAPVLTKMLEDAALWIGKNRDLIAEGLTIAIEIVSAAFRVLFGIINGVASIIRDAFNGDTGAIMLFGVMSTLVLTVAAGIIGSLVPAIIVMGDVLAAALVPILPWTVLLGAIIVITMLIVENWDAIAEAERKAIDVVVKGFKDFFAWFWNIIKKAATGWALLGSAIIAALARVGTAIMQNVIDPVRKALGAIVDFFAAKIDWVLEKIEKVKKLWQSITGAAGNAWDSARDGVVKAVSHLTVATNHTRAEDTAKPPAGSAAAVANSAAGVPAQRGPMSVSVGPTTINITGVKDAAGAKDGIADSIDGVHRHAAAALGGEVQ